jgi:hypothetical protein
VKRKQVFEKIVTMTTGWSTLRPTKSFSGRTLEQFKAKVQASLDARAEVANLEAQLGAAVTRCEAADRASVEEMRIVVHGVKADTEEGEDGELISAMGYVRRSQRSSGLTRRRQDDAPKSKTGATG